MDGNHARALLGVPADATTDQISRAFRGAAFVAHPDQGGSPARFRDLVTARDLLLETATQVATVADPRPSDPFAAAVCSAARPTIDVVDVTRTAPARFANRVHIDSTGHPATDFDAVLAAVLAAA